MATRGAARWLWVVAVCAVLPLGGCFRRGGAPAGGPGGTGASQPATRPGAVPADPPRPGDARQGGTSQKQGCNVIHVFVALCDNANQGIVPVPKALGNGQDPQGNLYWGAAYGVKTFFQRSRQWREVPRRDFALAGDGADSPAFLDAALFESAWPAARRLFVAGPVTSR